MRVLKAVPLAGAVFCVSWAAILIRFTRDAAPEGIAFWRLFFASLILSFFLLSPKNRDPNVLAPGNLLFSVLSGLFLAAHLAFWITSLELTSVASSIFLLSPEVVFAVALGMLFLGEKINFRIAAAILLAMGGSLVIGSGDLVESLDNLKGDVLSLLSGLLYVFYMLAGRKIRQKVAILPYLVTVYLSASFFLLVYSLFMGIPLCGYRWRDWLLLFLLALVPTIGGHGLFNYSVKYVRLYLIHLAGLGEPVLTTFLAFLILREVPSLTLYPGALLIGLGVLLAVREEKKRELI